MSAINWVILAAATLAALGFSIYTYSLREPHGRGRPLLIALRTVALVLLVLLIIDPRIGSGRARRDGGTRVVLDASLSMLLGPRGNPAWQRAIAQAQGDARNQRVLLAGSSVRSAPGDSLAALVPFAGESRMLPALQSAAEAGAQRVVLITDGAIDDADDVVRWLPTLGLSLDVRNVAGDAIANRAIRQVDVATWAEAGKPLQLSVRVESSGASGQAAVTVRQNTSQVARTVVDLPADGVVTAALSFTANGPAQGGFVRYDVAFETADSIPDDDVRSVYVYISEKPAGVALVSFDPDWEPRFLHPVLENALGLPVRTFLRTPAGLYLRGGKGLDAGGRVDEAEVRRAVDQADLLVLHGLGERAPEWAQQAARTARRLIVFPAGEGTQLPVATASAVEADWYVSADLPPSPIASLLGGIDAAALPPLNSLQATVPPDEAWAPLLGGRTRRGGAAPLVLAHESAGRRWVVGLAGGYWRWAFRGGAARDAYTRLWAALAGWAVREQASVSGAAIRPVERAVPRAAPLRWLAPGIAADSFVLAMRSARGDTSTTVMIAESNDTASAPAPAPGHYAYDVRAYSAGKEIARAAGPITVETYSREFIRRPVDLAALRKPPQSLAGVSREAGRPLHTFSWLYVLIVALLSAEWILRRRWGLR